MENKPKINNLEELRREKMKLRGEIDAQELILKSHYSSMKQKFQPILNMTGFLANNKLMGLLKRDENADEKNGNFGNILKFVMATFAGGMVLKNRKRSLMQTLFAYGIDQAGKFISEKDFGEHLSNIKSWFSKNHSEQDWEEDEEIND